MSRISLYSLHSMRKFSTSAQRHGRPCFSWFFVFICGLLCLFQAGLVGTADQAYQCPSENCQCDVTKDVNNFKWQNISCVNLGFEAVPTYLKTGADVLFFNLSRNSISSITADSFLYFTNLDNLDLSYNQITVLMSDSFSTLTNLQTLNLEGNDLLYMSPAVFELPRLVSLNLGSNPNITFPPVGNSADSFSHLNIKNCSIVDIPTNLLSNLNNLKYLDLSHNSITSLPASVFSVNSLIEYMDISHNAITTIDKQFLQNVGNLITLDISYNELSDLDKNLFKKQSYLESLDLSHNFLTRLDEEIFEDCYNLKTLDLSYNKFSDLRTDILRHQNNLQTVDLSDNFLTTINEKWFKSCDNLSSLDISDNSVDSIDSEAFLPTPKLAHLDLSNNKLTSINADLFQYITSLHSLDLSYNDLTSIPVNVFSAITGTWELNITNNDFSCSCTVRNYLYTLRYDDFVTLYDEDNIKCTDGSNQQHVFLDWFANDCSGNLGWQNCSAPTDCYARNSDCDDSNYCVCKTSYYDNNGNDTIGGVCKPQVDLGYPCDLSTACLAAYSECVSGVCKCVDLYYDTNRDTILGGYCRPMVPLGASCTMDSMCAPENSRCDSSTLECACVITHYDSEGVCVEKLPLYEQCNATYQCAPLNSNCSDGVCNCAKDYYDMDGTGTSCQAANLLLTSSHHRVKRSPSNLAHRLEQFCKRHNILPNNCRASSFFSCYLDETDGDDKPVEFTELKTVTDIDECKDYCFPLNQRHVTLEHDSTPNSDPYCLCGSTEGSTLTGCCPYSSGSVSCTKKKAGDITYVTAELSVNPIPRLTVGKAHLFSATASFRLIDQIKWQFGDTETEQILDTRSSNYYHTYTRSGKFTLTVTACMKSTNVCDSAQIPVTVQVPDANLTTFYITGYKKADVSQSVTDMTATFVQGYDFQYVFSRTDSSTNTIYNKGCETGWTAHRQTCLKLYSTKQQFAAAGLICTTTYSAQILEINYEEEISEIVSLFPLTSTDKIYLNARRQTNGAYQWLSDNSKTYFSVEHLRDYSLGDNVVIDASTKSLTSSDPSSKHRVVCMKAPVDCPKGGNLYAANGNCYMLSSTKKNWLDAKTDCISTNGGQLASLKDTNIHSFVAQIMTSSSVSEAWFGLSDRLLEGYYTWSDDSSYDMSSDYKPTITSTDEDCFVVNDASTWDTQSCYSIKRYICEYSIRNERLTVPSYIGGTPDIQVTGNSDLEQVVEMGTFTSTGTKQVIIFPGMWFTRSGDLRSWIVHTVNTTLVGTSYKLALQVYRPHCTASDTLIQPGCDNNKFASCSSTNPTCSSSNGCEDTEHFCYLSNQCKSFSKPCTCISEAAIASATQACQGSNSGSTPTYKLVAQTMVDVELLGERYLTIPADSIPVHELDIIGIEIETGKNVIQCENLPTSDLQQTSYMAHISSWNMKDDTFPSVGITTLDQTCFFHAIYTQDISKNLTSYLGYFDSTGSYSLSVEVLDVNHPKSLSIALEESVGDIKWVYPEVKELPTNSSSLGTLYIEMGVAYEFTLSVGRGTSLSATFSFDTMSPQTFQSTCPADVQLEVPNACDTTSVWSANPFTYYQHTLSMTGTQDLSITIANSIDSQTRSVTLKIAKRVRNVNLSCTTASNNIVAVNDSADFLTTVGDGTDIAYEYAVDGSVVSGSGDTTTHTFSTAGNINVSVTVSNILGSSYDSLLMTVILPANFQNCQFTSDHYIAAVGVSLQMSVTCEVTLTAVVQASWSFSDRPSSTPLTSTEIASGSTTVTWSQSVLFSSPSSAVTVDVTYTDLINSGSISTDVTVYEAVPSVNLVASSIKVLVRQNITFVASVPSGNYGNLTFTFQFGNGATEINETTDSRPSAQTIYFYTNPGLYNVTVRASNGPSQAEITIQVDVVETISGLTISSDSPTETGQPTNFFVDVNKGKYGVIYNFQSSIFDINVTQNTFLYVFQTEGNYTISVTAMNGLKEETGNTLVYIMDDTTIYADDLKMDGGFFTDCVEANTEHEFTANIIHFNISSLQYRYDFGDGSNTDGSNLAVKHTYATGNNYTLDLTVKYLPSSAQVVLSNVVCVQEIISSPVIHIDLKIGLPVSGSITKTASVTVSGTSPIYSWSTNASYSGSTTGSTFNLDFISTGFYSVDVTVSNEINSAQAATVVVEVLNAISGLAITCEDSSSQPCTDKGGHKYVRKSDSFTVTASITSGDQTAFSWNFDDGSIPTAGPSATKTYSTTGIYNVSVEVTNPVGTEIEYITVHVEEPLTNVDLSASGTVWLSKTREFITEKNELTEFQAVESPSGMSVDYKWEFETGLSEYTTSDNIAGYNYTTTGQKQCVVTVQNSINSVSDTFDFFVIEEIIYVNLKLNGTDVVGTSFSVAVDRLYNFRIYANTDVRCIYSLRLLQSGKYVDSHTDFSWDYTFRGIRTLGLYTLKATIENKLPKMEKEFYITVIEEITNPAITVVAGGSSITLGTGISFSGSALGTSPIYTWSYKTAPPSETFPAGNTGQSISLVPTSVGTYTVLLSVTNDVTSPQTDEYTFIVVEGVAGVSIVSSLFPSDAVKIGTTVIFSAEVTNGSDLTYAWDIDSTTGSQQNFSFHFATQKVYTLSVNVSNTASSGVATIQIYCLKEVPAFTLTVTGPTFQTGTNVAETGNALSFSSSLTDKTFISFYWSMDGTPSGSATTFSNTFTTPGSYNITLIASNKISSGTSQIIILIQDPITGLSVSNCLGTFAVNTDINMIASYQGTDVTVDWDIESLSSSTGISTVVNYATPGTYTVNATASNYVDTEVVSCHIDILGIIDNLKLSHSKYLFAGYPVTFSVMGDSLEHSNFEWTVSGNANPDYTTVPTWDYTFATKGDYTVTIIVSNAVSNASDSMKVKIKELECSEPVLTADSSTTRKALRASEVELGVTISNGGCTAYTSENKWRLYTATSCSAILSNEFQLPSSIITNTPTLNTPGATLPYGTYCAILEYSYKDTPVTKSTSFNLTIIDSDLRAILSGGDSVDIGEGTELRVDASASHDPDRTGVDLSYTWSCQVKTGSAMASQVCSAVGAITSSSAILTSLTLTPGDLYEITVIVSAPGRTSGVAVQQLSVVSVDSPEVSTSCISCNASGHYCVSGSSSLKLEGSCTRGCDDTTTYLWSVIAAGVPVTIDNSSTTTGFTKKNLVIKSGKLSEGVDYTFKLTATTGTKSGSASRTLYACTVPSNGQCDVSPTTLIPLTDQVNCFCQDWQDPNALAVLYYKVVVQCYDDPSEEYTLYYGVNPNVTTYIAPCPGSSEVFVFVYVLNDYGSGTKAAAVTLTFSSPTISTTTTDFIVSHLQNYMLSISQQNNPVAVMQYFMAVLSLLNEESRTANGTAELSKRSAVRDLCMRVVEGLPRPTVFHIQLMSSVTQFLTAYKEEIQFSSTLDSASALVASLTQELSSHVVQGMDQKNLEPNNLLETTLMVSEAYLHGITGMSSEAVDLFGDLDKYVLPVSKTVTGSITYSSDKERMQSKIEELMYSTNQAIRLPLLAMLVDEEEFSATIGTIRVKAQRVRTGSIWQEIAFSGIYMKVPDSVFSHTNYVRDEVLQIVKVSPSNPLNFNPIANAPVNTIVAEALFMDPDDGTEISVSSLPPSEEIVMYIFNNGASFYEIKDNLLNSPSYDPFANTKGTTYYLEATKVIEASVPKVHQAAAAIHIQITMDSFGKDGELDVKLYKDDVAYTAEDAEGVRPKKITPAMFAGVIDHRNFTFFDLAGTSESAYKVELTSTVNCNVTLAVYYSLCQYYSLATSSWDSSGCVPKDESIVDVIACGCNHMTSYGGSVLLSPGQIDFSDITRLDISSNPVAIITCSVILGLYIIVVAVCKKLDIMDVQRISTIPLCGKDGSFKYEVTMVTGRQIGAGTTANVGCRIVGEYGKSASQHLNKKGAFQRNGCDSFLMAYDVNLGEIKKILVWHDNRGTSPSWYLDHVIVKDLQTDKKYYFFCSSWLTLEEEKGSIQKELKVAGAAQMQKFSRQMKTATYNSLADKHLWLSLLNRPAQSRFTRVQRATCCVTLLYTFIAVNAMWYGLVKKNNSASIVGDFGWEEVVVGLVSNLMVFPINIGIIFLFKKSRSQSTLFDHGRKPQTAQTLEIENLCDNSQSGSFQSSAYGGVPLDLERESTMESLPRNATATTLHRSRQIKSQRDDPDPLPKKPLISTTAASAKGPMWNQDSIMKWPEKMPFSEDADSRPSTSSTTVTHVRQAVGRSGSQRKIDPGTADSDELLKYLDEMENDLKESEDRSTKGSHLRKTSTSSTRKHSVGTSRWGSLEDILNSDDESAMTDNSKKKLMKKSSTTSQTSQDKKFNPREDPKINGNGHWLKSRGSNASGSMIGGEHFYFSRGHISSEAGITAALKPGYRSQLTLQSSDIPIHTDPKEKCTLPSWCIYIAYILCFLLCTFSVILVILYCFKFGYEESLEWVLAFIFALFQSILLIEPVKAVLIAVYMVLVLKKVEQDEDDDCIDIEPTFDSSSEMIKDVKFKPISGFALMQAKEEGHKMHRMKVMLRQFIAYVFYLWLLMVIVYVNFPYSTYLLTKHVENSFVSVDDSNGSISFKDISSIESFWDWTENTFADAIHLQDSNTDEEHGFLLGVARMRLIRSTTITCEASSSAAKLGASTLTDRICYGYIGFEEDTASYGEGWNDSSYNYSWKYSSGTELGGSHKVGHVATYGGGGYAHNFGTTLSQTQAVMQDLRSKDWVDLKTRAVILELAIYSPGTDLTALVALLVEFPLTGSTITSYEIQTQKLLWFQEGRVDPLMICEVILLLVTIYSLVHIVISIRDNGKQFFKEFWNWYEMLTILMTIVAIGMYLGCVVEATNTFNNLLADQMGFTNFERVMYVHVGMRYLHAWLLFLLMFKVVKQLRFIKFMHIYEKTISTALGQLLAVGLIFIILLLIYAQVGYLMYGQVPGFDSFGHAIVTLIVMIRGTFDFWPMLDYQPVFTHFYFYSYYAFTYGLAIALVIAILNHTYKMNRSQMYYKATLDMQDYEMVEFMMKRFKLWAGIQKEKPAFRRVKFQGLPSISSRTSSSHSRPSSSSSSHQSIGPVGPEYSRAQINNMVGRLGPTWFACVKRFERILDLDKEEEILVKKAESEVKELNFRLRVTGVDNKRRELLNWTKSDKPPDQNERQSLVKKPTSKDAKTDKKPPTSLTFASRTSGTPPVAGVKAEGSEAKGKRPLSDQGARIELPAKDKGSGAEPKSLQKFFKELKPSKPAWNNNK